VASSVTVIFGFFIWRQTTGVSFALVQSETFTLMVISQWFNVLSCRSAMRSSLSLNVLKNRWLVGGLLLGVALHFLVIYIPSFNRVFHTVPIAPGGLLLLVILGSGVLWVEEIRKFLERRRCRIRLT
jgi:Ca2+-transporting ATPase